MSVLDAFWAYESALMANDLKTLDRLFASGPETLRGDATGLLVGHDQIRTFRGSRGGAPQRRIVDLHVREVDPTHALVIAVTELITGGRGQQTQLWAHGTEGWQVTAAHVAVSAPAFDPRVWRVIGDPLLPSIGSGPLLGESVAVKDLYAVVGQRVGAGNPTWIRRAPVEIGSAWAVQALLGAGADVRGIARTDEFAYSLAGTNAHSGTPPNPKAPRRISGGSSSGSASAVSLGHATIGLGTDTGGSIRVPAAYQGLYGIRTSHGAVPVAGLMPLAPSYDTVGWLTRDAALLATVGRVLLPQTSPAAPMDLVTVPALNALADARVGGALDAWGAERGDVAVEAWDHAPWPAWCDAFRTHQAAEAWRSHGWWLTGRLDSLGPDVRGRFEHASTIDADTARRAADDVAAARASIRAFVGDRVLVLPSASSVAPALDGDLAAVRDATMQLTCLAGIGGLPAVSIPVETADRLPCGVCLVAGPGRDRDLLEFLRP